MGNEVDFSGWVRTEENIKLIKESKKYRMSIYFRRLRKAIEYKRWSYFSWYNIKGMLLNRPDRF